MRYVGIDPGLSGAVALIIGSRSVIFYDTPTELVKKGTTRRTYNPVAMAKILQLIVDHSNHGLHIGIEYQQAMPKQGVSSTFSIGMGFGLWVGIVAALRVPYTIVIPRIWKKELMGGMGKEKGASVIRLCQLYPLAAEDLKRKKDHNRADAGMIAEYVRRRLK